MSEVQTDRKPLFSNAFFVRLIIPLILEELFGVTIGLADTFMVSSVGEAAVSGVSLVDGVNILFMQIATALATGGAVLCSQYIGHKDMEKAQHAGGQLFFLLLSISLGLAALALALHRVILRGIFGQIDANVMQYAATYFTVSALSYPFMGIYFAGTALFRSIGNSKISMVSSAVMNLVNIAGNAILIYGFGMGVLGAAIASLAGRAVAALAVLVLLQQADNPLRLQSRKLLVPQKELIGRMLTVAVPSGLENGLFQIGKLSVSSLVSTFGTASIAANAVCNSFSSILNIPGNALGLAMLTVIGQALGSGDKKQARHYAGVLLGIAYAGLVSLNLISLLCAPSLLALFHLSPEALSIAIKLMRLFNIVSIFLWPLSFTLPNTLRAGGDARFTMVVGVVGMWAFRVDASYYLGGTLALGVVGVWIGMFIDWGFRSTCFMVRFLHGKWMNHNLIN